MFLSNSSLPQRSASEQCLSTIANSGPSQIFPFLFLGSQEDVLSTKVMQDLQITHVINVSCHGERAPFIDENDDEHFLRIPVNDCLNAQLSPFFDRSFAFIEKARQNNGKVFIHCLAGISRSPALAVAYVMRHLKLSVDDAYRYIKVRRSHISPNFNFLGQLSEYERTLPLISSNSSSTTFSIPTVRCVEIDSSPSFKREHNNDQPKLSLSRPKCFNFDLVNNDRRGVQSLLSPSSAIANLSVDSPQARFSLPAKLLRPNSITLKRSTPTDEAKDFVSTDSSTNVTHKRVKKLPRSAETSPLVEKVDLINTFFEGTTSTTTSTSSTDESQNEPSTSDNGKSKSRTNSLSSSRELLVS